MFTTKENESVVPNHKIAKTQTMIARGNSIIIFFTASHKCVLGEDRQQLFSPGHDTCVEPAQTTEFRL